MVAAQPTKFIVHRKYEMKKVRPIWDPLRVPKIKGDVLFMTT